jgi:uncharacterized OB-fold protein
LKDFIDYLVNGEFRIAFCNSCSKKVWPPSYFCSNCFAKTELKKFETVGTVLEFTTSHVNSSRGTFGIVDLAGIRIVGAIFGELLYEGIEVRMTSCGITQDGSVYYDFEPSSDRRE